jgi:hypothetical protein
MPAMRRILPAAILAAAMLAPVSQASAQRFDQRYRRFPDPPKLSAFPGGKFTFCTLKYSNNGWDEPLGFGWSTDWPDSGHNFMLRLAELTTIEINRDENGEPHQEILALTDPALFNYPIVFMSDAGTCGFTPEEATALRKYLLAGGFIHVDDFWGETAWKNWVYEISQVLPADEYPIRDILLTHELFHIVFDVKELPQVPSIQYWSASRDGTTSERGEETKDPHFRGIWDKNGRLMMLMTHNTDIADGWEKERENEEYFREFSVKRSYPIGINLVVYALTH